MTYWVAGAAAVGAVGGALTNKKKPLQGALLGGTLGAFTGGVGGLGAAGAAGAAGTGAAGAGTAGLLGAEATAAAAGTAGTSGLLGAAGTGAAGTGAAGTGLLGAEAAAGTAGAGGLLGAEGAGASLISAEQAAAPVLEKGASAGFFDKANYATNGLLGDAQGLSKPIDTAMKVSSMFQRPQQSEAQITPSPFQGAQSGDSSQGLANIVATGTQGSNMSIQEQMRRRAEQSARIARIGGFA